MINSIRKCLFLGLVRSAGQKQTFFGASEGLRYLKDIYFVIPCSSEWAWNDISHPEFITLINSVMNSGWELSFPAHSDEHQMMKNQSLRYLQFIYPNSNNSIFIKSASENHRNWITHSFATNHEIRFVYPISKNSILNENHRYWVS